MRKNGSRLISIKQYKTTDLILFAAILLVSELLIFYAAKMLPGQALYSVSFMVPIVLMVMLRWGWQAVFYGPLCGLFFCILSVKSASGIDYACNIVGNAFLGLMLIPVYLIGKGKIASRWWSLALFAIGGWACVYLGRTVVWAIWCAADPAMGNPADGFLLFFLRDMLSLPIGVAVLLIMKRFDGMLKDQREYLGQVDEERRNRMKADTFGEYPEELDEDAIRILQRDDDLYNN